MVDTFTFCKYTVKCYQNNIQQTSQTYSLKCNSTMKDAENVLSNHTCMRLCAHTHKNIITLIMYMHEMNSSADILYAVHKIEINSLWWGHVCLFADRSVHIFHLQNEWNLIWDICHTSFIVTHVTINSTSNWNMNLSN